MLTKKTLCAWSLHCYPTKPVALVLYLCCKSVFSFILRLKKNVCWFIGKVTIEEFINAAGNDVNVANLLVPTHLDRELVEFFKQNKTNNNV